MGRAKGGGRTSVPQLHGKEKVDGNATEAEGLLFCLVMSALAHDAPERAKARKKRKGRT